MTDEFWEFREDEAPLQRALRTVTACSLGYKPQKPFGVCECCPAVELCIPITKGILAAAKHRLECKATAEDGIWCPRCGEVFHDKDLANEPTKFWTCPHCKGIQHQACRGPLAEEAIK